jgi:hypothetical protein
MKTPEDEAFDELAQRQGAWGGGFQAKRQAAMDKINSHFDEAYKKMHEDRAMYGTSWSKNGERIDPASVYLDEPAHCQCTACKDGIIHASDCAVHNGPAYPAGPCDCGVAQEPAEWLTGCPTCGMDAGCDCDTGTWNPPQPVQEPETFERWNAKQHGDPEEIGFLQALRIAYCAGQNSVTTPPLPAQEPVACERCKQLEEQAYDLLGQLKVANLKWSVAHPWVGLTDEEINDCIKFPNRNLFARDGTTSQRIARATEAKLKERNHGT